MAEKKKFDGTLMGGAGAYDRIQANPASEVIPIIPGASLQGTTQVPQSVPPAVDDETTRRSTVPARSTQPLVPIQPVQSAGRFRRMRRSFTVVKASLTSILVSPNQDDAAIEEALKVAEPDLSGVTLWFRRFMMDRLRRGLLWAILHAFRKFSTLR